MKLNSLLAISLMSISVSFPALADTRSEIIAALEHKTSVPVEFPGSLPNSGGERIYLNWSADNNNYNVDFDYTQDCGGATACNMGSFYAEKNGAFYSRSDLPPKNLDFFGPNRQPVYEHIKLSNNYSAIYMYSPGAHDLASIQWKINGVVYSVNLKNGTKEEVMKIANSVYN